MSTLSTANIQTKAANTPPVIKDVNGAECGQFCRAWVSFQGSGTVSINDNFNVSSITDNGTGDFMDTFSTAMSNANYAVVGMVANTTNSFSACRKCRGLRIHIKGIAPTASAVRVESRLGAHATSNGANGDFSVIYVAVFGG